LLILCVLSAAWSRFLLFSTSYLPVSETSYGFLYFDVFYAKFNMSDIEAVSLLDDVQRARDTLHAVSTNDLRRPFLLNFLVDKYTSPYEQTPSAMYFQEAYSTAETALALTSAGDVSSVYIALSSCPIWDKAQGGRQR
jgi:hypothetical protein